jgi:hypothetical protein
MGDLLTIAACFTGVFALSLIIAGVVGLQDHGPPVDSRATTAWLCDHLLAWGVLSTMEAAARNWSSRPEERRLLGRGIACAVGCVVCLWLAGVCA